MPGRIGGEVQRTKVKALALNESTGAQIGSHLDPISDMRNPCLVRQLSWYFPDGVHDGVAHVLVIWCIHTSRIYLGSGPLREVRPYFLSVWMYYSSLV